MNNSAAILETQLVTVSVIFHCHDQIPNKEQLKEEIDYLVSWHARTARHGWEHKL